MKASTSKASKGATRRWLLAPVLLFLPLWASCQTGRHLVLEPVGPPSTETTAGILGTGGTGFLRVYSATETLQVGKFIHYYPHTPYLIYTTNGNALRWVANAVANTDEDPAVVALPSGSYTIRAQDDDYGRVMVPVVIKRGQTTTVHLETRAAPSMEQLDAANSVRLPDGRIVGWRAKETQ